MVHFALCYIYSGESEIPENISIVELASLADYLCLEGLKEVVSCTLKMRYCHFFHKVRIMLQLDYTYSQQRVYFSVEVIIFQNTFPVFYETAFSSIKYRIYHYSPVTAM